MSYYDRETARHLDGTPIFVTSADEQSQEEVAGVLAAAWRCEIRSFGRLAPVDWFAVRDGRLIGLLELKTRTHAIATYPTVFLNLRKYLALVLGATGIGVPAIFVVRFTDGVLWQAVHAIDARQTRLGGCLRVVKSRNDIEPVIEVPVASMRRVAADE
jgi:hypothetical protein